MATEKTAKNKGLFIFLFALVFIAINIVAYWLVWDKFYGQSPTGAEIFQRRGNWLLMAVYGLLLYVFAQVYGASRIGTLKPGELLFSQGLTLFFADFFTYFQVCLLALKMANPLPMLGMLAVQIAFSAVLCFGGNKLYYAFYPPRRILMVFGSSMAEALVPKMMQRADKYKICGAISASKGLEAIKERIKDQKAVLLCDVSVHLRNKILKYCYEHAIRVYITPNLSDIIVGNAKPITLFDSPLLLCRNAGLTAGQRFVKRAMDIVISGVGLIVASPIMLITAIAIKLYDGGPVFFKQKRCTIHNKVFEILKFRSMIVDAEKDGQPHAAVDHDPRITPVGRVIRATRLDELPQLINILKGDMAVVGPRPERVEHVEEYTRQIPEFSFRSKVKGGLTGYAQVMGRYNTTAYDKLRLDLMYIENYSILEDIKLILMTVKIMFMRESTAGFNQNEEIHAVEEWIGQSQDGE